MSVSGGKFLGGYEERIRLFLGLLVLVLAAANAANFLLLRTLSNSLEAAVSEAIEARGDLAAELLQRSAGDRRRDLAGAPGAASALGIPPAGAVAGVVSGEPPTMATLSKIAEVSGCRSVALLDPSGRVIASMDGSPEGTPDHDFPAGTALVPTEPDEIATPPAAVTLDRGAVAVRFQAAPAAGGGARGIIKTVHDTTDLDTTRWVYRTLVWTQASAILVVLFAAFAFGRWIARPYRLIAREAGAADLLAGVDENPENLVAVFRRVMTRLRDQEEELKTLHGEAGSGSGIRSFADGVARGMTSGLVAIDGNGGFVAANPAAAQILGWPAPPAPGSPVAAWAGEGTPLERLLGSSLAGRVSRSREVLDHTTPGGRRLHLGVAVSPIFEDGDADRRGANPETAGGGVLCLIGDLTEIRDLEERVRRRESLAALGTVSAGIAHEVRNALATILGFARLAEKTAEGHASGHARAIAREVASIGRTVDDFLQFARPSRLNLGSLSLRPLLETIVEEARAAGLLERMTVGIDGVFGTVRGDEPALRQAFTNLVRNASESADRRVSLEIRGSIDGPSAVLDFSDDGDGIPPENLDKIFVPFFTTRGKGTGIGLALTQKTILDHDGSIEAVSPPEGGTRFRVVLPLAV